MACEYHVAEREREIGRRCCREQDQGELACILLRLTYKFRYSNPPTHGARVVALILSHPDLCASWHTELKGVSGRILEIRQVLLDALKVIAELLVLISL